jgi:hypothetical protein
MRCVLEGVEVRLSERTPFDTVIRSGKEEHIRGYLVFI